MDNPSKTRGLAKLCTVVPKTGFRFQGKRSVHEKGEIQTRNRRRDVRANGHLRSFTCSQDTHYGQSSPAGTLLRGGSEEKPFRRAAVSFKHFPKQGPPVQIRLPAQGEKVTRYLFLCPGPLWGAYTAQIIPPSENDMSAPKSSKNHSYPEGHQPWGHQTVRVY